MGGWKDLLLCVIANVSLSLRVTLTQLPRNSDPQTPSLLCNVVFPSFTFQRPVNKQCNIYFLAHISEFNRDKIPKHTAELIDYRELVAKIIRFEEKSVYIAFFFKCQVKVSSVMRKFQVSDVLATPLRGQMGSRNLHSSFKGFKKLTYT